LSRLEIYNFDWQVLNLSGNSLSEFPLETCSGLVKLRELHLANNQLAAVPACLQSHLGALHLLVLDGNKIASVADDSFAGLSSLHSLSLSALPELREVRGGALKGLAALRHFKCADNAQLEHVDKTLFFMGEDKIQQDWSLNTVLAIQFFLLKSIVHFFCNRLI
jgi:Leucine rich repeat